ncbi:MAG: hypothetical protein AAB455_03005 [Patescibacteria group bacterium]
MAAKVKGLTSGAMIVGLGLATGCDRVLVGGAWRHFKGRHHGAEADIIMPVVEVRAEKELTPELDVYLSGQLVVGRANDQDYFLRIEGEGRFESLGFGFDYYPFKTRLIGLEVQALEIFHAKYDATGKWWIFSLRERDEFSGIGARVGLTGEFPSLPKDTCQLVWFGGYNFTNTNIGRGHIDVDLDGWYVGAGLQFPFGN